MVEPIRIEIQGKVCKAVYAAHYSGMRALQGFVPHTTIDAKKIKRILLIELTVIGDMLVATPSIRALKKMYPHAKIDVMINKKFSAIYDCNPHIHELIGVNGEPDYTKRQAFRELTETIKAKKYDMGVILHFGTFSTGLMLKQAGIPIRAGCARAGLLKGKGHFLTHLAPPYTHDQHVIFQDLEVLKVIGEPYKALNEDFTIEMHYPEECEAWVDAFLKTHKLTKRIIAMHPGTRHSSHKWYNDRFVQVADWIAKKYDAHILFTGDAYDFEHYISDIQSKMKSKSTYAKTNLHQLQALLRRCDALVSVDTSMIHIGSAAGIPVLGLYGSGKPLTWGPYGRKSRVIFNDHVACTGCRKTFCNRSDYICMNSISVAQVQEEFKAMMQSQ